MSHHRTGGPAHDAPFDSEGREGLDQHLAQPIESLLADGILLLGGWREQLERRQLTEELDVVEQVGLGGVALSPLPGLGVRRSRPRRWSLSRSCLPLRAGALAWRVDGGRRRHASAEPFGEPAEQALGGGPRESQRDPRRPAPPDQRPLQAHRPRPSATHATGECPKRLRPQNQERGAEVERADEDRGAEPTEQRRRGSPGPGAVAPGKPARPGTGEGIGDRCDEGRDQNEGCREEPGPACRDPALRLTEAMQTPEEERERHDRHADPERSHEASGEQAPNRSHEVA